MKQYSMKNPHLANWLGGIAVGAAAMFLADPVQGKRRRLAAQQTMRAASDRTGSAFSQLRHGIGEQISAAKLGARSLPKRGLFDDEILQNRARDIVHRLTSFPEEIGIKAEQGCLSLHGSVLAAEKGRLVRKLRQLPGVREVREHLETKATGRAGWFSKEKRLTAERGPEKAAAHSAGLAGGAVIAAAKKMPVGPLLAVAGLGYAIKMLGKNRFVQPQVGSAARRSNVIHLQKSIEIQASPETVFNIWAKYDNFPQFMSHLIEIENHGTQHSRWFVQGPGGANMEWDVVLSKYMAPTMLAWKTERGTPIEHNGSIRFEAANGGTCATVRMFYGPGPGRRWDNLASLLGSDPEGDLEADLERMKNFIEGKNFARDTPRVASSSGQVLH